MADENNSGDEKASVIAFKCDSVNLLESDFHQEKETEESKNAKLDIGIEIDILENQFLSKLKISAHYLTKVGEELIRHSLKFTIGGLFSCNGMHQKNDLIDTAKLYSLSILWPYAREYSSDVFRRSGYPFPLLPVINPQDLTRQFIENDQIKINDLAK